MKLAHFAPGMSALKTFCGRRVAYKNNEEVVLHPKYANAAQLAELGYVPCERCVKRQPLFDLRNIEL